MVSHWGCGSYFFTNILPLYQIYIYIHSSICIYNYNIQYTYIYIYSRYITYENRPPLSWALRQQRLEAPDLSDTSKMAAESRKDPGSWNDPGSASTARNGINTCIYIYAYLGKYPYLMFMMISYHLCFYRSVQRDPTLLLVWLEGYGKHSWNFTQILTYGRSSSFVLRHFDKYRWHLLVPYWNHGVLSSLRFFAILEHKYIAMAISARSSV